MSVTYALLNDRTAAESALSELKRIQSRLGVDIKVRNHTPHVDELSFQESGLKKGMVQGGVFGAIGSAGVVAALTFAGVITGGLSGILVAFGLGGAYGTMVGAVAGTSCPDPALDRLGKEKTGDGLILAVQTFDPDAADKARNVLRRYGAVEARPERF